MGLGWQDLGQDPVSCLVMKGGERAGELGELGSSLLVFAINLIVVYLLRLDTVLSHDILNCMRLLKDKCTIFQIKGKSCESYIEVNLRAFFCVQFLLHFILFV